jgi:hypothetical protein
MFKSKINGSIWDLLIKGSFYTLFYFNFCVNVVAQNFSVVGIGNGQNATSGTIGPAPFGNAVWGTRHQFFITASELTASGILSNASISSVGLNVLTDNGVTLHNGFQLKIYNTASTNPIGAAYITTGLVSTSTATNFDVILGWNQINVTPFTWDGTSNLVIETCFNNSSVTTNAATEWTSTLTGTTIKSRYRFANTTGICSNTTSTGTSATTRPVFRFGWYPPAPSSITASEPSVCAGGSTILTANGAVGTTNWYTGSCGGTLINTGFTIAVTPTAPGETYYAENVYNGVSSLTCASLTVPVDLPPVSGVAGSDQTICPGTSPSDIVLSGSTGTVQWQYSTDNSIWINIGGATGTTLTSALMGTLTATRYYRAIVNSGACGSIISNTVTVIVNSVNPGNIVNTQTICFTGDPNPLMFNVPATATGNLSYQWQGSPDNITWTNLVGEVSNQYDPPVLSTTMYYRAIVFSTLNLVSCNSATNVVAVYINNPGGGTISSDQTICSSSTPAVFSIVSAATGLGALTYQWESSTDNITWNTIGGATAATYASGALTQTTYFRRMVTATYNGLGCSTYSNTVTVTVNQVSSGTLGSSQTICSGGDPDPFTVLVGASGSGVLTYQWQSSPNGSTLWSNITGATSAAYDAPAGISATTYYRVIVTSTLNGVVCTSTSGTLVITVNNLSGGTIATTQTVCSGGDPAAFTSSVAGSGSGAITYQWQSSTDNLTWTNITGATAVTYNVPAPLTVTTYYRRQTISTLNGVACTALSNTLTVNVNNVTSGVIGTDQTVCSGGDPLTLTFTTAATGTGTLSYQWQTSPNGTTWTTVVTTSSYNPPAGISATTYYRVIVTSTLNGVACTATSNTVTVTVNTVTAGTIGTTQTFCNSGDAVPFSFTVPAAAPGVLSYQWQSSSDNLIWADMSGETTTGFDPPVLTSTMYYRVIVTSTLNGISCTGTTNAVAVYINTPTGGTIGSNQTICSGSAPATFTVLSGATGLGTLAYQWESSTDNITWTTIGGATATTYASGALTQTTYFRRMVTATYNGLGCSTYSNTVTVTVNQLIAAVVGSNQTICSGSVPVDLTIITAATGSGTLTYQWQSSTNGTTWTNITGATSTTLTSAQMGALAATRYYRIIVYSTLSGVTCQVNSNTVTIAVNGVSGGTIATTQTVCSGGDPAAFTSSVAGSGSGMITYQWQSSTDNLIWTNVSLATAVTYNAPAPLTVTTYYRRQTISTLNGVACTAFSNTLTVNVNNVTSGVIGTDQTVCSGGDPLTLTFTTAPTGTGTLSYQWQTSPNGTTWITVVTTSSYNPPAGISTTTYYRVIVTSTLNGVACTATSNTVTVTVNTVTAGTIGTTQTFCNSGDAAPLSFTVPAAAPGVLTYQWQSSSDNLVWADMSAETTTGFDPPVLTSTMYYRVIVTSTLNGVACTGTTNAVAVYINTPAGGTIGTDQTICSGSAPATFTVLSGATGLGTLAYQWESSTDNITWNTIGGATATTYASGALTQTTYFRRMVTATYNGLGCSTYSNTVTVTVNQVSSGTLGSNQTICSGGDPDPFTVTVGASGSGVLTYQWQSSPNGSTLWNNITGATSATYDVPSGLLATTYYRVIVTSTLNGVACTSTSATLIITVNNVTGGTIATTQTVCSGGDPAAFTSSVAGSGSGTITYQWQSSTDNLTWTDITGATAVTYNAPAPLTVTTYYRRQAISTLNGVVCTALSNTLTVNVNNVTSGVIGADQTVCSGGDPLTLTFTTAPTGTGTLSYQWQTSPNGTTWTNVATTSSYNPPAGISATTYYRNIVTSTLNGVACTTTSNTVTITVNTLTAGTIGSNQLLCSTFDPSALTFITNPTGTGTLTFQWWQSNDNLTWFEMPGETMSSYNPPVLSFTTYFRLVVSSSIVPPQSSDSSTCSATSNTVTLTLNSFNPGTVGSDQLICSGGNPAAFTNIISPSGSGTYTYQWQNSTDNTNWTNVPATPTGTTSTYDPPSGLSVSTYYRRLTSHTAFGITCTLPTNNVFVGVYSAGTVSSSQNICSGSQPSALTVSGAVGTIQWQVSTNGSTWSPISGATGTTLTSTQMGTLTATRYYRTISGVSCTPSLVSNTMVITVLPVPTINAGIDIAVCSGSSVVLSGTGGASYTWNNGVSNGVAFVPSASATYTVTGTASNGCTNTDQVLVTVNPLPVVNIINNNPSNICEGQSFILGSSNFNVATYQWKRNGTNILGATSSSYTGTLAGSYTLFVTSSQGCTATSTAVDITITPLPTVNAGPDQSICNGESVTLTGSGAANYSWNNGVSNGVPFTPTASNVYTVSTTSGSTGCVGTDQVVVTVNDATFSTIYTTSMGNYFLNGIEYTQSGNYTQNTTNQNGCDSTITLVLTVVHAGLNDLESASGIKVYPNPSSTGFFLFNYPIGFACEQIVIVNTEGKVIREYSETPTSFDLAQEQSGSYYVEFRCGEYSYVYQIQKM